MPPSCGDLHRNFCSGDLGEQHGTKFSLFIIKITVTTGGLEVALPRKTEGMAVTLVRDLVAISDSALVLAARLSL